MEEPMADGRHQEVKPAQRAEEGSRPPPFRAAATSGLPGTASRS
jgi:hypothetical protein